MLLCACACACQKKKKNQNLCSQRLSKERYPTHKSIFYRLSNNVLSSPYVLDKRRKDSNLILILLLEDFDLRILMLR